MTNELTDLLLIELKEYIGHLCFICPDVEIPRKEAGKHKLCKNCSVLNKYDLLTSCEGEVNKNEQ